MFSIQTQYGDHEMHAEAYEPGTEDACVHVNIYRAATGRPKPAGYVTLTSEQARALALELRKVADEIDMTIPEIAA